MSKIKISKKYKIGDYFLADSILNSTENKAKENYKSFLLFLIIFFIANFSVSILN